MLKRTGWARTRTRRFLISSALLLLVLGTNCDDQKRPQPLNARPADQPAATSPVPQPRAGELAATQSATQPSTQPATRPEPRQPVSTYDSKPPYPVNLYVKSPTEKQPGWLRVEELANDDQLATVRGRFPEQNRIYVDTSNVRRIRIHVGHLPLRPKERVIVQIDGQGMVISRSRPFTTLELSPTGQWKVLKSD